MRWLYVIAVCLASSTTARADYIPIAPVRPLTMIDPAGLSIVGFEFQLSRWTEPLPGGGEADVQAITFDIAADFQLAPHWLLVARVPIAHASIDGDPANDGCCELSLGNVTVGGRGLWSSRLGGGTMAVMGGELTLSVPTASDEGERAVSALNATFARLPHDPGRYVPNTTTGRLAIPFQLYSRWWLVQAEGALALQIYDDDIPGDSADLVLRLAIGFGIRATYKVAILLELDDVEVLTGDGTATSLDFGVRYAGRHGVFGARVYVPLDGAHRDRDMLGIGFDAGLRF